MASDQTTSDQFPVIDSCLDEFDRLYQLGKKPKAADFYSRFPDSQKSDFVELIYHEFCTLEADGLSPSPDDYRSSYPQFAQDLEKLFAIHFGIGELSINPPENANPAPSSLISWPRPGDSIGPFKLVRCLGQGGMGQVFLAQQTDLADRLVVLKISTINNSAESEFLARLKHPNIMTVLRHFQTTDNTFHIVVMPYEPGTSLDALIALAKLSRPPRTNTKPGRRSKPIQLDLRPPLEHITAELRNHRELAHDQSSPPVQPPPIRADQQIALWMSSLAEALASAFKKGVIHGDVKPGNIYLSINSVPYLLDFHLARTWFFQRHRAVIDSKDPGGTLLYMPPERLRALSDNLEKKSAHQHSFSSQQVRHLHRGDLYSLGIVILELMTGYAPMEVDELAATNLAKSASSLAAIREHPDWLTDWPGFVKLPTPWRKLLKSLLAADPALRPSDGFELANQLKAMAAPRASHSLIHKFSSVRPQSLLALAAALAVLIVAGGLHLKSYQFKEKELVKSLWRHPDELWNDPSSLQEKSPAAKLRSSRTDLDQVLREHPQLLNDSNGVSSLVGLSNSLDLDLWTSDRIEAVTRTLAERAEKNSNRDDAESALDLLKRGLAKWNLPVWRVRYQALSKLLGHNPSPVVSKHNPNQIISEYISIKDQNLTGSAQSIRQWENLLRQTPESFAVRWAYARSLVSSGQFANAIDQLRILVKMDENHFESRRLLAFLEYQSRDFHSAITHIEAALNLRSDDISSLRLRAILRIYSGQREELRAEIQRLGDLLVHNDSKADDLAFDPAPDNQNQMDSALNQLDESKQIFDIKTLESLLTQLPNDNDIKSLLFKSYINHRRFDDAERIMEEIVSSGNNQAKNLINLALAYQLNNKPDKFIETGIKVPDSKDISKLYLSETDVRIFCSNLLKTLVRKKHHHAFEYCNKMLEIAENNNADSGRWHFYLAHILINQNGNDKIDQVLFHLTRSGQNHSKYLSHWYRKDKSFMNYRNHLDEKLKVIFPSIQFEMLP